jgi:hypothetical protein
LAWPFRQRILHDDREKLLTAENAESAGNRINLKASSPDTKNFNRFQQKAIAAGKSEISRTHGEPQPERDLQVELDVHPPLNSSAAVITPPISITNMTRFPSSYAMI